MIIIKNDFIPFKGFKAILLLGILFVRRDCEMSARDLNHEKIHMSQSKELLFIFFYIWYLIEWVAKLFKYGKDAYYNISFEREAHKNSHDLGYIDRRKFWSFINYM